MTTSLRILLSKRFEGDKSIALGFGRAQLKVKEHHNADFKLSAFIKMGQRYEGHSGEGVPHSFLGAKELP